ncbi:MAG: hypothetical protein H6741_31560 [Alphaproteobacteria bacterium]|nr:hypothetical protein [Alphaproteobacteria bacterium]
MLTLPLLAAALAQAPPAYTEALSEAAPPEALDALLAQARVEAQAAARSLGAWGAEAGAVEAAYDEQVLARLQSLSRAGLRYDAEALQQKVLAYERFKMERYASSGVFPKRYFGYVDLDGDTAAREAQLLRDTHAARLLVNDYLAEQGVAWRVTDAEILVTFIAEGGALMLGPRQHLADDVHPVYDIGLDDVAHGSKDLAPMMQRMDAELGSGLQDIVLWKDGEAYLRRNMSFQEAVLGTALMWVWEKQICARKLAEAGRAPLEGRPLDQQFILGSLVYNSGILFSDGRMAQIRDFRTGEYLQDVSVKNEKKRWLLDLLDPAGLSAEIVSGVGYREQPTAWNAVYHVLQRWGGYAALDAYTSVWGEDGMIVALPPEPPPPAPAPPDVAPPEPAPPAPVEPSGGCASVDGGAWFLGLLLLSRRRRLTSSGSRPA